MIWAHFYGEWPTDEIDHINGNRNDNRIKNLRQVSRQENSRNMAAPSSNTSGVVGVCFCNTRMMWMSYINLMGKMRHLGFFNSFNDAVAKRKAAERQFGFHKNHGRSEAWAAKKMRSQRAKNEMAGRNNP